MGQPLTKNPFLLLMVAVCSLFLGAAFVYMSNKSPFFWGDLFLPGALLLLVFVVTALLAVLGLLMPVKSRAGAS